MFAACANSTLTERGAREECAIVLTTVVVVCVPVITYLTLVDDTITTVVRSAVIATSIVIVLVSVIATLTEINIDYTISTEWYSAVISAAIIVNGIAIITLFSMIDIDNTITTVCTIIATTIIGDVITIIAGFI